MRAVNLLPADAARGSAKRPSAPVLVLCIGILVVTLALAVGFLRTSSRAGENQRRLDDAQAQLEVLGPAPAPPSAVAAGLGREQQARLQAVSAVLANRVAWDRVLRDVSLVIPDDVWLTNLAGTAPVPAAGQPSSSTTAPAEPNGVPTGLTLTGFTYSHRAVARALARIALLPDLLNVQLQRSARTELGGRTVVTFTIAADVRKRGEAT